MLLIRLIVSGFVKIVLGVYLTCDSFNPHPATYATPRFSFFGVRAEPSSVSNSKRNKISMSMISKYDECVQDIITNTTEKT